jgi:cysteine desulfurase
VVVNGPAKDGRVANNLNIAIPGLDAEMAVIGLDAEGIAVSTRSACNTGDESPSHVIQALGTPRELLKNAVRITLLPDATKGDVVAIAVALEKIAKRYKTTI